MPTRAVVRSWRDDEGWGVLDSPATPGGCWAHYSAVATAGYRTLAAGQVVELDWEAAEQDGYAFRAVRVLPAGGSAAPADSGAAAPADSGAADIEVTGPYGPYPPYASTLTITFDEPRS